MHTRVWYLCGILYLFAELDCDRRYIEMVLNGPTLSEVNVLVSEAKWAWPEAMRSIFAPRGVNLLVARDADEFLNVIERRRIHTTIVDMDWQKCSGLATIKIIRMGYPLLPCILLTSTASKTILDKALQLSVFAVVDKPVDMDVLRTLLNKLFMKIYGCDIIR